MSAMSSTDEDRAPVPPAKPTDTASPAAAGRAGHPPDGTKARESGGPAGLEPTRYGDWEVGGRCSDF